MFKIYEIKKNIFDNNDDEANKLRETLRKHGTLLINLMSSPGAGKTTILTETHDKPLKYPLMFSVCNILLISKIDVLPYFDFDLNECIANVKKLNPGIDIIPVSAKTGEGLNEWADLLEAETRFWKKG